MADERADVELDASPALSVGRAESAERNARPALVDGKEVAVGDEKPTRILHLSDLHFGSTFDLSLWQYVAGVLDGAERPSVIAVTGDLVDSPTFFMLSLARNELRALSRKWCANDVPCDLLVIPGNHDVGLLGNWAPWPLKSKFRIVFAPRYATLFDKLPSYSDYRRRHWAARIVLRLKWTLKFAVLRASFKLRCPSSESMVTTCAEEKICVARFDSSTNLKMASGYISSQSISRVHRELMARRAPTKDGILLNLVPRIALVHHHVIAIPYSSATEKITDFEPFLTLRNAGTLLRELCAWDFDLVLHGHKHMLNFARISFESADQLRNELAVLSAGSATKKQSNSGQNSFNLVKVFPNGTISFRSVKYGLGVSGQVQSLWSSGFQRLLPLRDLKVRAFSRAQRGQEIWCDSTEMSFVVESSGAARCEHLFRGMRGIDDEQLRRRQLDFCVNFGAIAPNSFELDQASMDAGHVLLGAPKSATQKSSIEVRLAQPFIAEEMGTDFGVRWKVVSAFATSRWECLAMGQADGRDWVSMNIVFPSKHLRLSVVLPKTFERPQPKLIVKRCPGYPLLYMDKNGSIDIDKVSDEWTLDPDMTELEKNNVTVDGNVCDVNIEYPMVGYCYELRWKVDVEMADTTTKRIELAKQIRKTLLQLCVGDNPRGARLSELVNEMLTKATTHLLWPLIKSRYSLEERLDCALFVYDDSLKEFRTVAQGSSDPTVAQGIRRIPLNAGVTGAAFKQRGVSLYIRSEEGGSYLHQTDTGGDEATGGYATLLAIPLTLDDFSHATTPVAHDSIPPAPEEAIGVFTIASTAGDSLLVGLGEEKIKLENQELVLSIWTLAVQYFRGVSDAIQSAVLDT